MMMTSPITSATTITTIKGIKKSPSSPVINKMSQIILLIISLHIMESFQNNSYDNTVFSEIFVVVLISDVTFITKFKKLNN